MHKRNFSLTTGACLNDDSYGVITFDVKAEGDDLYLLLPETEDLDAVIGTSRWMTRQATAELLERVDGRETTVEITGPADSALEPAHGCTGSSCTSNGQLEW